LGELLLQTVHEKQYLMNHAKNLNSVPIGAIGELYIGGAGLGRGYLGKPGLTADKFIASPFQAGARIYKTGDLARWLPSGELEYIGRNDFQVKIRGFRVELGEIETTLQSVAGIKQCIVDVKENLQKQKRLIAYIIHDDVIVESISENKRVKIVAECREICNSKLPDYMLPTQIILIDRVPLTPNGKLDREALPLLDDRKSLGEYEPPCSEPEHLICSAFEKVLMIKNVGMQDDFFMLGGNSIQVVSLVVILQVNFDVKVKDIFKLRTPKMLTMNLRLDKNVLIQNLQRIKSLMQGELNIVDKEKSQHKDDNYLKSVKNLQKNCSSKNEIINVLLTGATGFLGCNILNQLLQLTNYNICLLIRARSRQDAFARINQKYQFYFQRPLSDSYCLRINVINADIEYNNLGHGSLSTVFREQFAAAIPPKNEWILNSAVNCWLIKRQHV